MKELNDGSFDDKNVNTHQLNSYHKTMKNKVDTLTEGSSQPEVFNVVGQLSTIERIKQNEQLERDRKQALPNEKNFGATQGE